MSTSQDHAADCVSLRERKARQTRQALQDAALDLVSAGTLEGVTVAQIAERAEVSPRTFFNYFSSKEDAVVGLSAEAMNAEARRAVIASLPERSTPVEEVAYALRAVFSKIGGKPSNGRRLRHLMGQYPQLVNHRMEITRDVESDLVEAIAERLSARGMALGDEDSTRMLILVCKAALQHTYRTLQSDPSSYESEEAAEAVFADSVHLLRSVIERLS
ncbi:TetR family transcriptional regulator [Brevibacterium sp. 5221]|uniref:TetR family transcriptional regulator n=1 Tax=Brevibacterium rongguiense TaxID=2695267 RepID=A0A6N9HA02_9MICO|nr:MULTISPECIES: TetR/AcrR family transcriptional regulator [Brevibacterium]MYM20888.1 TetR family transcriptional regulator [Brevibacterium rongguiense]WAL41009.1 TetR/AcrR family transcriptional regulator [Brevibacterium sp. BRM-1]